MTTRIFIDGAAGTTGLEIHDRLKDRSEFELIVLDDARRKDEAARREALHEADVAILCLPDDAARESVKLAEGSDTRIIDASSAHRVAEGWTYGFPELVDLPSDEWARDIIANAQFVSNPGCYPTGFLALMQPLILDEELPADWPYTVNAVSGYSGGGNALIDRFAKEPDIAFRSYALGTAHKHLPEMKKHAAPGGLKHAPVFAPAVVPALRGMIVEVPLNLAAMHVSTSPRRLHEGLRTYVDGFAGDFPIPVEPLISVPCREAYPSELLLNAREDAWDGMELFVFASDEDWDNPEASSVRLIARLDNLGKGASGAAIQNLNIMCGLPETTGLRL